MTSISSVVPLRQPDTVDDPLTAVLRSGARRFLAQAIEAEADALLAVMKSLQLITASPMFQHSPGREGAGPAHQHGRGDAATHLGAPDKRDGVGVGPGGRPVLDIYVPDLQIGSSIGVPTRDVW